jgi:Xaa-Pro aminopeptidase
LDLQQYAEEAPSPVANAKAIKNEVELEGMRQCHLRDAAAVVSIASFEIFTSI